MTTPESEADKEASRAPERIGELSQRAVIAHGEPVDQTTISTWRQALRLHGPAFLAYLSIPGIDATSETIADQFVDDHRGTYPDLRTLCEEVIDELGWNDELAHLENVSVLRDFIVWDYAALTEYIREVVHLVEIDGRYYTFAR